MDGPGLPRGAKTHLARAKRAYVLMRRHGVRGPAVAGPEYKEARDKFLAELSVLSAIGVPQKVTAAELGISRAGVSQWLHQT